MLNIEMKKNELHNINDEPAVIWKDGSKIWRRNGKKHRTKGPAAIHSDGDEYWFYEGNIKTIDIEYDPEKTIDYILKDIGLVTSLSEGRRLLDNDGIKVNGEI